VETYRRQEFRVREIDRTEAIPGGRSPRNGNPPTVCLPKGFSPLRGTLRMGSDSRKEDFPLQSGFQIQKTAPGPDSDLEVIMSVNGSDSRIGQESRKVTNQSQGDPLWEETSRAG